MNHIFLFWSAFVVFIVVLIYLDKKYAALRDTSTNAKKPYSFAKVQFAWWMVIILSGLVEIVFTTWSMPVFNQSTLILLGISAATIGTGKVTELADKDRNAAAMIQNMAGENLILDILTDRQGVSLSRLQTVAINLVFGFWFIHGVLANTVLPGTAMESIFPVIDNNNLVLLGLSYGTYAGVKTTENR